MSVLRTKNSRSFNSCIMPYSLQARLKILSNCVSDLSLSALLAFCGSLLASTRTFACRAICNSPLYSFNFEKLSPKPLGLLLPHHKVRQDNRCLCCIRQLVWINQWDEIFNFC